MSEWRDISTAPKDGTNILLFCPEAIGFDGGPMVVGYWRAQGWNLAWVGGYATDADIYESPSLWQPLPEPPTP